MALKEIKEQFDLAKLYITKFKIDAAISSDMFYGKSALDIPIIDRFIYKGKGRPRKIDYTDLLHLQKKVNGLLDGHIKGRHYYGK